MAETQDNNKIADTRLRRMSSITRKLHLQLFWKKVRMYVCLDLIVAAVIFFGWILDQEFREFGGLDWDLSRSFVSKGDFWHYYYEVSNGSEVLLSANFSYARVFLIVAICTLVSTQALLLLGSWHSESKKIRKTLQPINEIALKADAMSRLSFTDAIYGTEGGTSEESYHRLEEAIQGLSPDQETMPSLGDQELVGIEAAMNNLLRRMHESYQQQARFVNDASHELRTPIAVIQGYANMLDRWGREDESVLNESITAITHEADHMNQLVEQLLFLARGDSGRTKLKQEPINLNSMMQEIYEESLMIDESHPYRFKMAKNNPNGATGISVIGDPMLLKQAVRILLDNAAKYTKPGDEISLSVGLTKDGCPFLQVQDSGIGMAESDVEHMFERFYRSDEAREIKGTGLGLAIAKWIVDRHKGHFEILSRTELGTRIRLVLPIDCLLLESDEPKKDEEFEDAESFADEAANTEETDSPETAVSTENTEETIAETSASAKKDEKTSKAKDPSAQSKTRAARQN